MKPRLSGIPVMRLTEWLLIAGLSVVWGGSFFFIKVLDAHLPPFTIVFYRVLIAALVLLLVAYATRQRLPRGAGVWGAFFIMAAFNNVIPFCLIVWGETHIGSGLAAILNSTTPLFTIVLAQFFTTDERMTVGIVSGIVLGIAGVAMLVGWDVLTSLQGRHTLAELAVLGAAFSYACAAIFGRRFRKTPPLVTATGQLLASVVLTLPPALLFERPLDLHPGAIAWSALLGLGIVCTAIAYLAFFRVLAVGGATNSGLVTLLIPISALALGVLVLHETTTPIQLLGLGLILMGLLAVDGRLVRAGLRALRRRIAADEPGASV